MLRIHSDQCGDRIDVKEVVPDRANHLSWLAVIVNKSTDGRVFVRDLQVRNLTLLIFLGCIYIQEVPQIVVSASSVLASFWIILRSGSVSSERLCRVVIMMQIMLNFYSDLLMFFAYLRESTK